MAKNVVGLFDNMNDAQAAVRDLRDAGFNSNDISFVANNANNQYSTDDTSYGAREGTGTEAEEGAGFGATGGAVLGGLAGLLVGLGALAIPGIGPVVAAGTLATTLGTTALGAGLGAAAGGLVGALVGAGIPEEDANVYAEGIRRGGALVSVQVGTDNEANRAADIMDRHNVVDIDERGSQYRQSGWNRFDENSEPYSGYDSSRAVGSNYNTGNADLTSGMAGTAYGSTTDVSGTNYDTSRADYNTANTGYNNTNLDQGGEVKIPIVEEEMRVGKRQVEGGGVRVNTRVEEQPVNEQVTLREERVDVHRRPVDRAVSDADLNNLQGGTFEVRERSEEAVVDKQARVVEEVHLKKNVEDRTENIQDTVRRTDVDVDQVGNERSVGYTDTNRTTTGYNQTGSTDEGMIERGGSKLGNSVERGLGTDLDNDGDVGQRDPRNNY